MEITKRQRLVKFTDQECVALLTVAGIFEKIYNEISEDEEVFDGYMDSDLISLAHSIKEAAENKCMSIISD